MKSILVFGAILLFNMSFAQDLVSVTGEGIIKITPDRAIIKVRVENTGEEAKQVQEMNNETINSVMKSLRTLKFDMKDVKTEYINLNKNYNYDTKVYSYIANQTIVLVLKDLSQYENIMNRLMVSGINRIDEVSFTSSEINKYMVLARKKAVEDAKQKALDYVGVLGQKIGKAKIITEAQANQPRPMYDMAMMKSVGAADNAETIAVGDIEVKSQINVSFELN